MTVEDIERHEDAAARIDAKFARDIKELDATTATKIYDIARKIVYHNKRKQLRIVSPRSGSLLSSATLCMN
ncbi:unnamed protein product [marine sediment metagenome]|uniref:Uncharacterized protein n=1 Tax=marine sediment metagenome TaxID=412755 RepID=X1IZS3_9ZZZZ